MHEAAPQTHGGALGQTGLAVRCESLLGRDHVIGGCGFVARGAQWATGFAQVMPVPAYDKSKSCRPQRCRAVAASVAENLHELTDWDFPCDYL